METFPGVPSRDYWMHASPPVMQASIWMRLGFVALCVAAAAAVVLFNGEAPPLKSLALMLGAGFAAVYSFHRSLTLIDLVETADETKQPLPIARPAIQTLVRRTP